MLQYENSPVLVNNLGGSERWTAPFIGQVCGGVVAYASQTQQPGAVVLPRLCAPVVKGVMTFLGGSSNVEPTLPNFSFDLQV
jgi:hypothetical protein